MTAQPPEPDSGRLLIRFVVLSVLVHLLLVAAIAPRSLGTRTTAPPPLVVGLAPSRTAPRPPEERIVSPSDRSNDRAPTAPAYRSDRDNTVERQSFAHGVPEPGSPQVPAGESARPVPPAEAAPPPPAAAAPPRQQTDSSNPERKPRESVRDETKSPKPPAPAIGKRAPEELEPAGAFARRAAPPREERAAPLPGLDRLLAPPSSVLGERAAATAAQERAAQARSATDPRRDLLAAPAPARAGLLAGLRGNFDELPDVAPGSITMLNTKADRFAPFVRRIGTRVFQNLLIHQRRDLDANEVFAAREVVTIRALLDPRGKLTGLEVMDRSGSAAMDQTLLDALREAAFDDNPPKPAANTDGNFEFLFQAQIAANVVDGPRGPQLHQVESRLRIGLL